MNDGEPDWDLDEDERGIDTRKNKRKKTPRR
jgi:hypothetical protein